MLRDARILIVEAQSLIALDIQRALEDANARHMVFARNWREVAQLGDQTDGFDLAIVTPPGATDLEEAAAFRLARAGTAMVVCTAFRPTLEGTALSGAETVDKPFHDDELIAACSRALARRARVS